MYIHQIRVTILQMIRAIIQPNRYLRISDVKYESNITNNAFNGTFWRYRFTFAYAHHFSPLLCPFAEYSTGQLAWILRRNDRNEPRNEITFHLPSSSVYSSRGFTKRFPSHSRRIDWFIGVSILCKYLFLSLSCFSSFFFFT